MPKRYCLLLLLASFARCHAAPGNHPEPLLLGEPQYKSFYALANSSIMNQPKEEAWKQAVAGIRTIHIPSSLDSSSQPALFYDSGSKRSKPLLMVLHSWNGDYLQQFSIPYGVWAARNDWVFIHPHFRGPFSGPQTCGSQYAIQDILDALNWARSNTLIDPSRIYLSGFSGGAMMTLSMVGRFPQLWSAAVAWVPVYDLNQWYQSNVISPHGYAHQYAAEIESICGGVPNGGNHAALECARRSPSSVLQQARGSGVKLYIATGLQDPFVAPSHALMAFNTLANQRDKIPSYIITSVDSSTTLPAWFVGSFEDAHYSDADQKLLWRRRSNNVTISIFEGKHDVVYNAGLVWLSEQRR